MSTTYAFSGKIQKITVETTGDYNIAAYGGQGGANAGSSAATGGLGAEESGTVHLTAGEVLEIIVGGAGAAGNRTYTYTGGGGGGGTFILANVGPGGAYVPLLVAGGGGGGTAQFAGGGGTATGASGSGSGGTAGVSDGYKYSGGGGAGAEGNGGSGGYYGGSGGYAPAGGAVAGSGNIGGNGGFGGGGGGGNAGGGGGGGFTGGSGGYYKTARSQGGTSYAASGTANPLGVDAKNAGNGKVVVDLQIGDGTFTNPTTADFPVVNVARTWSGATGDFYDGAQWTTATQIQGSPNPGDPVTIASGTVDLVGTEARIAGLFDDDAVTLGSGTTSTATINAIDATMGGNFDITAAGNMALQATGVSSFEGDLTAAVAGGTVTLSSVADGTRAGNLIFEGSTAYHSPVISISSSETLRIAGTVTLEAGAGLSAASTATVINDGTVDQIGTSSTISGALSGTGTFNLEFSTTLLTGGSVSSGQTINFGKVDGRLRIADLTDFHGNVTNFTSGNLIDFTKTNATGASYSAASKTITLTTNNGSTVVGTLANVTGPAGDTTLVTTSDGSIGTTVSFNTNTRLSYEVAGSDDAMQSDVVRSTLTVPGTATPITGAGVKIGIISDSFNVHGQANANARLGYLPSNPDGTSAVTIVREGPSSGEDEGQAMAELVHQVAPGAQLYFASGDYGQADFAAEVQALKADGCTIIVDDLSYYVASQYQVSGTLATAINTVVEQGTNYFTSASNYGHAFYQGTFSGQTVTLKDGSVVEAQIFSNGTPYEAINVAASAPPVISVYWTAPFQSTDGSSVPRDLTFKVFDSTGKLVGTSKQYTDNGGNVAEDSFTLPTSTTAQTYYISVINSSGAPLPAGFTFSLDDNVNGPDQTIDDPAAYSGNGNVAGQELVPGVNTVGAIFYGESAAFGQTAAANEGFSAYGPGQIYTYDADGNPVSSVSAGKVNFSAPDGSITPTFNPFFGTSAAAPNAAAVAALMLQADGRLTNTQISYLLAKSAIPILDSLTVQSGAGLIQAPAAVQSSITAATTPIWTAQDGTTSWVDAANWSDDKVPGTGDTAQLTDGDGLLLGAYSVVYDVADSTIGGLVMDGGTTSKPNLTIATGDSLTVSGTASLANNSRLTAIGAFAAQAASIDATSSLVFDEAMDAIFSGILSGAGQIVQMGSGILNLTGINSAFTGIADLVAGVLELGNNAALGSAQLAMSQDTTLDFADDLDVANNISSAGTSTFSVTSTDTLTGVISDTVAVANGASTVVQGVVDKTGAGTLMLDDANTYSGGTTIEAGTLDLAGTTTLNSAGVVISGAAGTGEITFGAGANATLRIEQAALTSTGAGTAHFGNTVAGFAMGDTMDVRGIGATVASFDYSTDVLTLSGATTTTLQLSGNYVGKVFTATPDGSTTSAGSNVTSMSVTQPAPTIGLVNDTGTSSTDRITSEPSVTGTDDAGAAVTITDERNNILYSFTGTGGTYTIDPASMLTQGAHTLTITETRAGETGSASTTFTYDSVAPTIAGITLDKTAYGLGDTVSAIIQLAGISDGNGAYTLRSGSTIDGAALTAGSYDATNNSLTASFVVGADTSEVIQGNVPVNVTVDDAAANASTADTTAVSNETIDTHAPTAVSVAGFTNGVTDTGTAPVAAGSTVGALSTTDASPNDSFTYALGGNDAGRFAISNGVLDVGTTALTDGTQYDFTVTSTDLGGNRYAQAVRVTGATTPTVQSIVPADPSPTNASSDPFTVTFSQAVSGVQASNFTLSGTDGTGTIGAPVTTDGVTYTVPVTGVSGNGTLGLDLTSTAGIASTSTGTALGGERVSDSDYTIDTTLSTPAIAFATSNSAAGAEDVNAAHAAMAGYTVGSVDTDATATVLFTGTLKSTGASGSLAGDGTNGSHTVDLSLFRDGTVTASISDQDGAGNARMGANATTILDTTAPTASSPTLTVAQNASATPIGIAAPSDSRTASASLAIVAGSLPNDGTVTLTDGTTAVTAGESLTLAQLTSLEFTPTAGAFSQSSTFTYTVTDGAGNASQGTAALAIGPSAPTITGTGTTTTAHQAPLSPFASVMVGDPNGGSTTDSVTIKLSGALGALAGSGLMVNADGSYSLASASAATLTSELDTLTFAPLVSDTGPVEATDFTLTLTSSTGTTATDGTTVYTVDSTPNQGRFGTTTTSISSVGGEVFALYEGLLGRAPDQVGAEQWVAGLTSGAPLDQVTQGFLTSNEGSSSFTAGSSNVDFVNQLYDHVLGRAGDAAGEQGWINALNDGASRADVADGFLFSQEHTMDLQPALSQGVFIADNNTSAAARLYYGLLDRAPDSQGLATQAGALDNGQSLTALARSFLRSSEYQSDNPTPPSNQAFVDGLYQNAVGRAPDMAGGQGWVNALDNGSETRAQVAVGIVESAEAQGHLAGRIENGFHLA